MKNKAIITVILTTFALSLSCAKKETTAKNDITLLTKVAKINAENQEKISKKVEDLTASQIENKISINNLTKSIQKVKEDNQKLKNIIKIANQENKKIKKALEITIKSQESLIKQIQDLKKFHDENKLIQEGRVYVVSIAWLNVREKPTINSKKITILCPGTKKRVYGKDLDNNGIIWYKIDQGYVSSKYTIINVNTIQK